MSNEREEFEKRFPIPDGVFWCENTGYRPSNPDAVFVVVPYGMRWEAWQACAERKQREIDEQDSRYAGMEESLATICAEHAALTAQVEELRESMQRTIGENGNLADGENCTLRHLVRALSLPAYDCLKERDARKAAEVLREAAGKCGSCCAGTVMRLAAAKERGE